MNSLREQWANKTSGKGSTTAWDQIQDEMKVQFPNKSKEDKEKNYKRYSQDSTRIAKHMWLVQGFYIVLSKRLPKEFSKKLVRPIRADGVAYDLDIPVIMKAENA
jgi:hypothetical protein